MSNTLNFILSLSKAVDISLVISPCTSICPVFYVELFIAYMHLWTKWIFPVLVIKHKSYKNFILSWIILLLKLRVRQMLVELR